MTVLVLALLACDATAEEAPPKPLAYVTLVTWAKGANVYVFDHDGARCYLAVNTWVRDAAPSIECLPLQPGGGE